MKSTTETGNVSQQPECLSEEYRPYVVVIDAGIPYEEEAADLEKLKELLKSIHQKYIVEAEDPEAFQDIFIYDSIDRDISESQAVQEMIADILEEAGEVPSPAKPEKEQCALYPEAKCCPEMCDAAEKVACGLDPGYPEVDVDMTPEQEAWLKEQLELREKQCMYGFEEATRRCAICGAPLCASCGFTHGDGVLCNGCWELDPR